MNGTTTHWTTAENAATLSASGENPPVGSVVSACATALYASIRGASPPRWSPYSRTISNNVNPRYTSHSARAVSAIRGVSFSIPTPGASASTSCAPPTDSSGRIATANTTIPIPPSHCVSWRHNMIACEWRSNEIFSNTVAPVVVNPLIDSNNAFTGFASAEAGLVGANTPGTP
jgi:hypothetical protein